MVYEAEDPKIERTVTLRSLPIGMQGVVSRLIRGDKGGVIIGIMDI